MKTLSRLFCLLLLPLLLLSTEVVFAKPAAKDAPSSNNEQGFDAAAANKVLTLLKTESNSEKITPKELQAALLLLNKFQLQAKKCIDTNTIQLDKLNQRLIEISTISSNIHSSKGGFLKDTALTEEQKYLNSKKEELSGQLSECRLFSLRAEEETADITEKLHSLVTTRLLYAHPNILTNIKNFPVALKKTWRSFDKEAFMDNSGFTYFNDENIPLLLLPLFVIFTFFYTNNRLKKKIIPLIGEATAAGFSLHFKQALIAIASRYLPVFAAMLILTVFFSLFTHSLVTPSYFAYACYAILAYILFVSLTRFYFYPPAPAERFTHLPKITAKILSKRLKKLALLCLFTYLVCLSFSSQAIEWPVINLFRTIIITLLSLNLISIIWEIKNFPKNGNQHVILRFFINVSLVLLFLFIVVVECLGYHLLASYILFGVMMTIFVTFVARLLSNLISAVLNGLAGTDKPWQQNLRRSFGLKRRERLIEILWLHALLYAVLWLGFIIALLKIWGLGETNFQIFVNYLLYGANIGTLHIIPLRIVIGALFFIILALATRWFRTYIAKANWQLEAASRESLASIMGYVGFATAFILGALIAGVNFSGLALVAGALAVGIGFGLQNIVNNFVSGIILLIERPVKLGDRILIGKTEGYVKKISIRSTRIMTSQCADVIVPNSELVSQQVINYMLHDLNFRISVAVGIAYGSDVELAKNILLSIAKTHPQVIADRKDIEPAAYFRAFGESCLDFELYCVIKDVNQKFEVISDLNFAIEKAFREKGINIAFPQREIKITHWPQNLLPNQ